MTAGLNYCGQCNKELSASTAFCPFCGAEQNPSRPVSLVKSTSEIEVSPFESNPVNSNAIPDGIKGWSWGAFFLNWIWAIGNNTWIGLLAFIPYIGFIMAIILGFKGREWAWKNKKWDSVEHFNRVQRKWSNWGVGLFVGLVMLALVGIVAAIAVPAYQSYVERARHSAIYAE